MQSSASIEGRITDAIDSRWLVIEEQDFNATITEKRARLMLFLVRTGVSFHAGSKPTGLGNESNLVLKISVDSLATLLGSKEADELVRNIHRTSMSKLDYLYDVCASYLVRWLVPSIILPRHRSIFRKAQERIDAIRDAEQDTPPSSPESKLHVLSVPMHHLKEAVYERQEPTGNREAIIKAGIDLIARTMILLQEGDSTLEPPLRGVL